MSNSREAKASAFFKKWCTHTKRRDDAIIWDGREMVPTTHETKWISDMVEFRNLVKDGASYTTNADSTEIWLTLPDGYKFSCQFKLPDIPSRLEQLEKENGNLRVALVKQLADLEHIRGMIDHVHVDKFNERDKGVIHAAVNDAINRLDEVKHP